MTEAAESTWGRVRRVVRHRLYDGQIRRIVRDAGITTTSSMIAAAIGIARASVVTHYLGLERYGLLGIAISAPAVVRGFLSPRTWEWVVIELAKALKARDAGLAFAFVRAAYLIEGAAALLSVAVVAAFGATIANYFLHDRSLGNLIMLGLLIDAAVFPQAVATAVIRVTGDFKWLAWFRIWSSAGGLPVLVAPILLDLGIEGCLWAFLAQAVLGTLWIYIVARSKLLQAIGRPASVDMGRVIAERARHLRTLFFLSLTSTTKLIGSRIEQPLIGLLSSPATVGLYRTALVVADGIYQLSQPLYVVYHVEMNKVAADRDRPRMRRLVRDFAIFGLAVGVVSAVGITVLGPFVVRTLFGAEFHQAGPLLQLMGWGMLLLVIGWQHPLFIAEEKTGRVLATNALGSAAQFLLLLLLVPSLQGWGAAIAYVGSRVAMLLVVPLLVRGTWVFDGWQPWRRVPEE